MDSRLPRPALRRLSPTQQQALGVSVATGAYGLSFGALSVTAGLDVWQTQALSLLLFTGGSQFAFIGIVAAGGGGAAAVATSTLLGIRNGFYGVALAPLMRPLSWRTRVAAAHVTIDESTAVALAQKGSKARARQGFWWTGIGVFVAWNAITLLGALAGQRLGDPTAWGLDAAAAAAFLALLWPRLDHNVHIWVAAGATAVALALTPVAPAGVPIMAAAVVAIAAGTLTYRRHKTSDEGAP